MEIKQTTVNSLILTKTRESVNYLDELYWIIYGTYRDYFKTTLYKSFCWQHFGGIPACINPFRDVGGESETAIE